MNSWQKFETSVNIQVVRFCHLNYGLDYCAGIRSLYGTAEQPVFPACCEWADRILVEIVGKGGGNAEAESEPGKEPDGQCIRDSKF